MALSSVFFVSKKNFVKTSVSSENAAYDVIIVRDCEGNLGFHA